MLVLSLNVIQGIFTLYNFPCWGKLIQSLSEILFSMTIRRCRKRLKWRAWFKGVLILLIIVKRNIKGKL